MVKTQAGSNTSKHVWHGQDNEYPRDRPGQWSANIIQWARQEGIKESRASRDQTRWGKQAIINPGKEQDYILYLKWHGGDQFVALLRWYGSQVSLTVAFGSSAFCGLLFLIFLLTIPHRFSIGFRSGEFAGQSSTPTPSWSFNQLLVLLAEWAGAKFCWKMKSASLKSWSAEGSMKCFLLYCLLFLLYYQNVLVNGCSDVAWQFS